MVHVSIRAAAHHPTVGIGTAQWAALADVGIGTAHHQVVVDTAAVPAVQAQF